MKTLILIVLSTFLVNFAIAGDSVNHKRVQLDLPEGWNWHPAPASDEPHLGRIKSSTIAGASITVDCYRGFANTHTSTRIRALKTIAAAYPGGQEQLEDESKIETQDGKGTWESWRGIVVIGDQSIALFSPLASIKTSHCWLVMIGYTAESNRKKLLQDFQAILKTAR